MTLALDPALRALLRRRADALRAVPPEARDEDLLVWAAVFRLGDDSFAFRLEALKGILPLGMVTPVPLAGRHVVGVTRFQGELVTVLSFASLLGGRAWPRDATNLLVLESPEGAVAVDCTDVPRAVALPPGEVLAAAAAGGSHAPARTVDGDVVQLIDVARLVAGVSSRGGAGGGEERGHGR